MPQRFFRCLLTCFCLLIAASATAQPSLRRADRPGNVARYDPVSNARIPALTVFETHRDDLGLSPRDRLVPTEKINDRLGQTHYRFRQEYRGTEIEGVQAMVHSRAGFLRFITGNFVRGMQAEGTVNMTRQQAVNIARNHLPATTYLQMPDKGAATCLRWVDSTYSAYPDRYRLAWRVDVVSVDPLQRKWVYVDAENGNIVHSMDRMHTVDATGIALTRNHGQRTITTDSLATHFRLRESLRPVETFNLQTNTNLNLYTDFTDTDNFWNNINPAQDEIATDAHWGAEMTYDYFLQVHGRNSWDGNGDTLRSLVHWDEKMPNAAWFGDRCLYGDGDSLLYKAFTAIDVTGHEFTHGVVQATAGLVYMNEPGALNESFADIFGVMVERFADTTLSNWTVGEMITLNGQGFRDFADPKARFQPATYQGEYWYTGSFDNGGVHINSGIGNYWFYLLSVGGAGTNDFYEDYQVQGIGRDKAAAIAYRALTLYLTPNSLYPDMRSATVQSAEDLYGACSQERASTINAWHAVGVGYGVPAPFAAKNLELLEVTSPLTACATGSSPTVSITLRHVGCADYTAQDSVTAHFRIDGGPVVSEAVNLPAGFGMGDQHSFSFTTPASFPAITTYNMDCWLSSTADTDATNDSLLGHVVQRVPRIQYDTLHFGHPQAMDTVFVRAPAPGLYSVDPTAGTNNSPALVIRGRNSSFFNGQSLFTIAPSAYMNQVSVCINTGGMSNYRVRLDARMECDSVPSGAIALAKIGNTFIMPISNPQSLSSDPFQTYAAEWSSALGNVELQIQSWLWGAGDRLIIDNIRVEPLPEDDAGITDLLLPQPIVGPGPENIQVRLRNFGATTLTSADISYEINGTVFPPTAWTGNLAPGTGNTAVLLGSHTFSPGANDLLRVWTSNPNGNADDDLANDTLEVVICPPLAGGVYSVGGTGADFATVGDAVAAMACGGIAGPVHFQLTAGAGPFYEQVTLPEIAGASTLNTITFDGGPTREEIREPLGFPFWATLEIEGTDHLRLHNLRITSAGHALNFSRGTEGIEITGCLLQTDGANSYALQVAAADSCNGFVLRDNELVGGLHGAWIFGSGTTGPSHFDISSNAFLNSRNGLTAGGMRFARVHGNTVILDTHRLQRRGLFLQSVDSLTLTNNVVRHAMTAGIYVTDCGTPPYRSLIANNMVSGTVPNNAISSSFNGFILHGALNTDVWYNSVWMHGQIPRINGFVLNNFQGIGLTEVRNNSFAVTGASEGTALVIWKIPWDPSGLDMDDNNFWAPQASAFFRYVNTPVLPAQSFGWNGLNTGSYNRDPHHVSLADLHLQPGDTNITDKGLPVLLQQDIDGQVRNSGVPDIGADEVEAQSLLAGFGWTGACAGAPFLFSDSSTHNCGVSTSWSWDLNDDGIFGDALGTPVAHSFSTGGFQRVGLIVQTSMGCTDTVWHWINVLPAPTADFSAAVNLFSVSFTDQSSGAIWWEWDFGDASPVSSLQHPQHSYAANGAYVVTLVVGNGLCTDTLRDTVTIAVVGAEAPTSSALMLYPNPARYRAQLGSTDLPAGACTIAIHDLQGRLVRRHALLHGGGAFLYSFRVDGLGHGDYVLRFSHAGGVRVLRFRVL